MTKAAQDPAPKDLLLQPAKVRLEYFKTRTIKHPLLVNAFKEVRSAVLDSSPGSIIQLFGPPGAGKTTLLERLSESLTELLLPELEKDRGRIPIALVRLDSPLPGKFQWKDFFRSLLTELKEPQLERKINIKGRDEEDQNSPDVTKILRLDSNDHISCGAMRVSAMQALKYRNPLAVLVDDSQHFGQIGSGRKLLDQVNIIKSMAEKSRVTIVLAGTYELLPFLNLNGQLSRRSIDVHFGRYHADEDEHQTAFTNALYTFQQYLPLDETPDLCSHWDYFYEGSVGCIGILKDWLNRSLALALEEKKRTLLPEHLERRILTVRKRASILNEILTGERNLEEESDRAQLRIQMGLEQEIKQLTLSVAENKQVAGNSDHVAHTRQKRRKRQAGRRNPKRDKVDKQVA